jgi:secretion/DNA translocation related CpaE-like protein
MSQIRPLLVTNDADLLDDLLRLAAAADVEVDVAVDPVAARAKWTTASVVVLGGDVAGSTALSSRPARAGVLLVCRGSPDGVPTPPPGLRLDALLRLPDADDELVARLAAAASGAVPPARVIGVVGGCGGAGASVLAAALGLSAARRRLPATLVDLDPIGGGVELLLGIEDAPGSRWAEFAGLSGGLAPAGLRQALPVAGGLAVLSYGRDADPPPDDVVCAVLETTRRGGGVVVLDLPRHVPAVPAAVGMVDEIVVVVPATLRAASAAVQVTALLDESVRSVGMVVRRPAGAKLPTDAVVAAVKLPLLGSIRAEPGLAVRLGAGYPLELRRRGPLSLLCNHLLDETVDAGQERAA